MSLFGRFRDRLGGRKGQLTIVGTTKIRPPTLWSRSAPASQVASRDKSLAGAGPTGAAPLSYEENRNNKSTMTK
jgi:hypothetical protein